MVKASVLNAESPGLKMAAVSYQWLPCQMHSIMGSVLGLVGLVSVSHEPVK